MSDGITDAYRRIKEIDLDNLPPDKIEMTEDEKKLRKLLWLNHGCSLGTLYGDGGEMQCNKCLVDFKRDPVDQIEKLLFKARNWTSIL